MKPQTHIRASLLLALLTICLTHSTALAQGTAFTYQGRVTDNGTNFTGSGRFKFALVTSTNNNQTAAVTANAPSGGYITTYNVASPGSGYVGSSVSLTIYGGGGSGAAAHGNISGGQIVSISVDSPGNGLYTTAPTVVVPPPPPNITYTTYWSNDGTSSAGSEPAADVMVPVTNGLFTVALGDPTLPNMAAIDPGLFGRFDLQLLIWFNDGVNGFAVLTPAQNLTPAPYADYAWNAVNAAGLTGLTVQLNTNGAPNMIGGSPVNYVATGVIGATIGGGGTTNYLGQAYSNSVTGDFGTIGGGYGNSASAYFATVGGGLNNSASGYEATVGGGANISASGSESTVGGGAGNSASGIVATVGGGEANSAGGYAAIVGGGAVNSANGDWATVGGGQNNSAAGYASTVGGGYANSATNNYATVPGGYYNSAGGQYSFAAGNQAQALHNGAFVWADSQGTPYSSDLNNQFKVRAGGGVLFDVSGSTGLNPAALRVNSTSANGVGIFVAQSSSSDATAVFTAGGTGNIIKGFGSGGEVFDVVNSGDVYAHGVLLTSDRNAKENFSPLDARSVLAKVVALPLTEWNYKVDAAQQKHMGPMAQDFHAAFGLNGADDKHISVVDESGVALAAIQGLNQKIEEQKAENADLKQQLAELKQIVNQLNQKLNGGVK